jgi:HEAT repeat protein
MVRLPNIALMKEQSNIEGLLQSLRYRPDPSIRAEAARALGSNTDWLEASEGLVYAHLSDPDAQTRRAAKDALDELLGTGRADDAIASYREAAPGEDEWLLDRLDDELVQYLDDGGAETGFARGTTESSQPDLYLQPDSQTTDGLIKILRHHPNLTMRLKAAEKLGRAPSMNAIDALAVSCLFEEQPEVKAASRRALSNIYGSQLDSILEAYHQGSDEPEDGTADRNVETEATPPSAEVSPYQQYARGDNTPVIEPVSNSCSRPFLLVFVILCILVLLIWLLRF